jgi:hypothetical protein
MQVENDEEASMASLLRLLDHMIVESNYEKYEELQGRGGKIRRDLVVEKAFQLIVGKNGDLDKLLFRWFNKKDYFKKFRQALIKKIEGFFLSLL